MVWTLCTEIVGNYKEKPRKLLKQSHELYRSCCRDIKALKFWLKCLTGSRVWTLCTEIVGNCGEKPRKLLKRRKWTVQQQ
jgi:hypothetical protein